jgi:glycosyltransferase involved in cell wall biosynthesis
MDGMEDMHARITFLITSLDFGGAETQLVRVALRLSEAGWKVAVISMLQPVAWAGTLSAGGVALHSLDMKRGAPEPAALLRLVRLLRQESPEILVSFMYHANLLARLAARPAGVRITVSSIRNENFGGPRRDRLLRLTDGLASVTTTNSRLAAAALQRRKVVHARKLRVIPNGLDLTHYDWNACRREQARQESGCAQGSFLWLAAGRLEEQKDYPTLLTAFERVARERPEAELRIAGHGSLQGSLEEAARRSGLQDRIRFLGARGDIPDLLAAADALVLSSAWEGLPNIVMEAMAAGKPVVATEVGGVSELVADGVSGLLLPPGNPAALSEAMLALMDLPAESRRGMGQAGRQHVGEHYAIERVTGQWQELFTGLLQE